MKSLLPELWNWVQNKSWAALAVVAFQLAIAAHILFNVALVGWSFTFHGEFGKVPKTPEELFVAVGIPYYDAAAEFLVTACILLFSAAFFAVVAAAGITAAVLGWEALKWANKEVFG